MEVKEIADPDSGTRKNGNSRRKSQLPLLGDEILKCFWGWRCDRWFHNDSNQKLSLL